MSFLSMTVLIVSNYAALLNIFWAGLQDCLLLDKTTDVSALIKKNDPEHDN